MECRRFVLPFAYNNHWLYQPPFQKGGAMSARDSLAYTIAAHTLVLVARTFAISDSCSRFQPQIGSYHN